MERNNQYDDTYYKDISTEELFIQELRNFFGPTVRDVDFSEDGKHIIGVRFMIQGTKIYDANQEKQFVEELRAVCDSSLPYEVFVFHPYFIYFDQVLIINEYNFRNDAFIFKYLFDYVSNCFQLFLYSF